MNEKEIIEGNLLIIRSHFADDKSKDIYTLRHDSGALTDMALNEVAYHKDWSLLMPVVEKIEGMGYDITIRRSQTDINGGTGAKVLNGSWESDTKINSTWLIVVQFIKWYNENKTK